MVTGDLLPYHHHDYNIYIVQILVSKGLVWGLYFIMNENNVEHLVTIHHDKLDH